MQDQPIRSALNPPPGPSRNRPLSGQGNCRQTTATETSIGNWKSAIRNHHPFKLT